MKVWRHDYLLTPLHPLNAQASSSPRKGSLLKVQWSFNETGYSDLFCWPEFGDPSLEELLEQVPAKNATSALVLKSLWRNRQDARARFLGRSLFQSLIMAESHGLLTINELSKNLTLLRSQGFRVFKIKMTDNFDQNLETVTEAVSLLNESEKLRWDFNGALSLEEFQKFIEALPQNLLSRVDLIEDPWTPSPEDGTRKISPCLQNKLAGDFFQHPSWPHRVLKTARGSAPTLRPQTRRVIQTHSMDHPLGQAFSLWEASLYERRFPHRREIHGVARPSVYASTDFDWAWNGSGPRPQPPKGLGIGFDELLRSIRWEKL